MNSKLFLKLVIFTVTMPFAVSAFAQNATTDCRPGISFGSLIGSVRVGYTDGRLSIDKLYAVCLPMPAKQSESNYPYNPDTGGKLSMVVKSADGRTLNTYVWSAERFGTLWEMSRYKVVGGYEAIKPLGAGNFVLEFAADDKLFYKFPFSVVAIKSDDPYQPPGNRYFIEGPWNEYGNLFYQRGSKRSVAVSSASTLLSFDRMSFSSYGTDRLPSLPVLSCTQVVKLSEDCGSLRW